MVAAFWLMWPGPDEAASGRRNAGEHRLGQPTWVRAERTPAVAEASVAVSAKGQPQGDATAARDRLERRLRKVARTMPEIGVPDLQTVAATAGDPIVGAAVPEAAGAADVGPAALMQGAAPRRSEFSEAVSRPSVAARGEAMDGPAAVDDPMVIARIEPSAGPASPAGFPAVEPESKGIPAVETVPKAIVVAHARRSAAVEKPEIPDGGRPRIARTAAAATSDPRVSDVRIAAALARAPTPAGLVAREIPPERAPTWLRNAVAPVIDDRPAIAVVIDDLGPSRRGTRAVIDLEAPLTLSFLPYGANLDEQTRAARAAGHELMVHVPMQPVGAEWPGPNALLSSLEPAELVARLRSQLHSFGGFVGINNHMGSLLTADHERMALVMAELRRGGLLFLDSRTTPQSVAADEAARQGVPHAVRDVFLDGPSVSIWQQLAEVEQIAARRGTAVAIGHPHDRTIEALRAWLPTLAAKGFALVPISTIVARHACAGAAPSFADACAPYTAIANLVQ